MSLQELLQCGGWSLLIGGHAGGSAEPLFRGFKFAQLFGDGGDFESFFDGGGITNKFLLCGRQSCSQCGDFCGLFAELFSFCGSVECGEQFCHAIVQSQVEGMFLQTIGEEPQSGIDLISAFAGGCGDECCIGLCGIEGEGLIGECAGFIEAAEAVHGLSLECEYIGPVAGFLEYSECLFPASELDEAIAPFGVDFEGDGGVVGGFFGGFRESECGIFEAFEIAENGGLHVDGAVVRGREARDFAQGLDGLFHGSDVIP